MSLFFKLILYSFLLLHVILRSVAIHFEEPVGLDSFMSKMNRSVQHHRLDTCDSSFCLALSLYITLRHTLWTLHLTIISALALALSWSVDSLPIRIIGLCLTFCTIFFKRGTLCPFFSLFEKKTVQKNACTLLRHSTQCYTQHYTMLFF